jgi:hypothetical protein
MNVAERLVSDLLPFTIPLFEASVPIVIAAFPLSYDIVNVCHVVSINASTVFVI